MQNNSYVRLNSSLFLIGLGFYLGIYFMVDFRTLFTVVICLSAFVVTCDSQSAEKKKVQVASLIAQQQEQIIVPSFSTLEELLNYKDEFLDSAPENVLIAFQQYQINHLTSPSTKNETSAKLSDVSKENEALEPNEDVTINLVPDNKLLDSGLNSDTNSTFDPLVQELDLSTEERFEFSLALSDVHLALSKLDTALIELDSLSLSELDIVSQLTVLEKKAQILNQKHDFFNAVRYLTQANELAMNNDLSRQSIFTALQLSAIYVTLSDKDKTLYWQQEATDLLSEQDDLGLLIEASILLAKQQQDIGQHLNATRTLVHVIDLVSNKKYYSVEASLRLQMSDNFKTAQQYVNAEQELERSYKLAVKSRDQEQQLVTLIHLIDTYAAQNKFDDAKPLLKAAKSLERFLVTEKDKRDYELAKAQVLAGGSQYKKALALLDELDMSDIFDENVKHDLIIELLNLKSNWLTLDGDKQAAIQSFNRLIANHLAQQQMRSDIKLDFVIANYKNELAELKQQLLESKKQDDNFSEPKEDADYSFSSNIVLLFIGIVVLLGLAYFIVKWLKAEQSKRIFLDPVSGANNHNYFIKHVKLLMKSNTPFSLIMFDIDNMRKVNDKLGFELGDKLLALVVERLDSRLGSNKLLVRLSGDKFIVIAKDFSLKQAFALAEVLRKELNSNKFYIDNLAINLSASFGVSYCYGSKSIDKVKDEVQDALDKAKIKGGNITQEMDFC